MSGCDFVGSFPSRASPMMVRSAPENGVAEVNRRKLNFIGPKFDAGSAGQILRQMYAILGVASLSILVGLGTTVVTHSMAEAQSHDEGSHSDGGHEDVDRGRGGGSGGHDDGHDEDDHDDGHEADGPRGSAVGRDGHDEGGHEEGDHEGRGRDDTVGQALGGKTDGEGRSAGGGGRAGGDRSVWAQEGIPEVELGRLNVARSPSRVLDRAFSEALASFTPEVAAFYRLDLNDMVDELSGNWDSVKLIDSPLQNLALMRDALDGTSVLSTQGIATDNDTLLAVFLGTASDKAIPVSADTATAISAILGVPLSPADAAALAEKAERIRQAIFQGHG